MATWKKVLHSGNTAPEDIGTNEGDDRFLVVHTQGEHKWKDVYQRYDRNYEFRWYQKATIANSGTARRRWYYPPSAYGPNHYNWYSYRTGTEPYAYWFDGNHPCIVIPRSMTLVRMTLWGNNTSTQDLIVKLMKNSNTLLWNNQAVSIPIEEVGNGFDFTATAGLMTKQEAVFQGETFDRGDILIPHMARDTNLNSETTSYFEGSLQLEFQEPLNTFEVD